MTNNRSALRTTQMRYCCWNLVSTPKPKSDGYPTLNDRCLGSKMVRGRKKAQKHQEAGREESPTEVQMMGGASC